MEDFCKHPIVWLKQYFLLPNGIPSHDTFYRVFAAINPEAFQVSFLDWVKEIITLLPENIIPIDGKSICASRRDKFNFKALHIVSAFSCANGTGLKSLVLIISERESHNEKTIEYRYYISSLEPTQPQRILSSIRHHWQIENNLHWLLDVAYKEDQCRIPEQNTALNMAWLRKTALGLLKRAEHIKGSIRRKQLAIWAKPQYLVDIVQI